MDEPKNNGYELKDNVKSYYTSDWFFDILGEKVDVLELNTKNTCENNQSKEVSSSDNFKIWHVEYREDPNITNGLDYLSLPMPKLDDPPENYAKYVELMNLAFKHTAWHTSHHPYETSSPRGLAQEVNQKLLDWSVKS